MQAFPPVQRFHCQYWCFMALLQCPSTKGCWALCGKKKSPNLQSPSLFFVPLKDAASPTWPFVPQFHEGFIQIIYIPVCYCPFVSTALIVFESACSSLLWATLYCRFLQAEAAKWNLRKFYSLLFKDYLLTKGCYNRFTHLAIDLINLEAFCQVSSQCMCGCSFGHVLCHRSS